MQMHTLLSAIASCGLAGVVVAQPIAVLNHSFEEPVQQPGGFTQALPPGWVVGVPGGTVGVFYPTQATWNYAAPHGNQLLYLNSATVQQDSAQLAQAGQIYTLRVQVVHRPGFFNQNYLIQLMAGATVLGADAGTLTPPVGGALTSTHPCGCGATRWVASTGWGSCASSWLPTTA